ncbi:MAG: hypothetical protein OES79_00490 [Planctomycetota bacterium]|nr:hypothetical protein [Planctomycetota bacterium]
MAAVRCLLFVSTILLVLVMAGPLLAGASDMGWASPPATRPSLAAVHPGIFALFQLLVSVTALVAFPPHR